MLKQNRFKISIPIIFLLVVPTLFGEGMFLDGVYYASIARNLSENYQSIWSLSFSQTYDYKFFGHLPLGIWMQSLLFRIFGDFLWVERIYCLSILILSIIYLDKLVKSFLIELDSRIVLLVWFCIPITYWSYSNNTLEITVELFLLISMYYFNLYLFKKQNYNYIILSSLFAFIAFLSKGPGSCFIILYPLLVSLIFTKYFKIGIKLFIHCNIILSVFIIALFIYPSSGSYINNYLEIQFYRSIEVLEFGLSRLLMVKYLVQNLCGICIFCGLLYFRFKEQFQLTTIEKKTALINIILGLSGVLPIMLSIKQSRIYLFPAMIFFAMSFAIFLKPLWGIYSSKLKFHYKWNSVIYFSCIIIGLIGSRTFGTRDLNIINEISSIKQGNVRTISNIESERNCNDWVYQAYLQRINSMSFICTE